MGKSGLGTRPPRRSSHTPTGGLPWWNLTLNVDPPIGMKRAWLYVPGGECGYLGVEDTVLCSYLLYKRAPTQSVIDKNTPDSILDLSL